MIILGVDPGTRFTGYAILKKESSNVFLLDCGYLNLGAQKPLPERVYEFGVKIEQIIQKHAVTVLCLETSFLGKNAQNFLKLGYLRGVLYFLAQKHKINRIYLCFCCII